MTHPRRSLACLVLAAILASGCGGGSGSGAPATPPGPTGGLLDPTFDSDGIATVTIGGSTTFATSVLLQPDGKILVAGHAHDGTDNDILVVRLEPSGALDATFGGDGIVTTPVSADDDDSGRAIALQPDGKIVVAGYTDTGLTDDVAVLRYTADGSLDGSFGGDGVVTTTVTVADDRASGVAIQADGRIVVAGTANLSGQKMLLLRYNDDGSLDTAFDADGIATLSAGGADSFGNDVVLQPDGRILVGGAAYPGGQMDFAVARFTTAGAPDTTFDGDGIAVTAIGSGYDEAHAIALQPDGRILLAGHSNAGLEFSDFALARYLPDGGLDASFGSTGIVTVPVSPGTIERALDLALNAEGSIVMAGFTSPGADYAAALVKITPDGDLDPSFGAAGIVTTGDQGIAQACTIALQADGRIVTAGYGIASASPDLVVMRYD